jgi:hypothetical protein
MLFRVLLLIIFLQAGTVPAQHEITVWEVRSGNLKLYHSPESRWYGAGEGGSSVNAKPFVKGVNRLSGMVAVLNANSSHESEQFNQGLASRRIMKKR